MTVGDVYLDVAREVLRRRGYSRASIEDLAPVWAAREAVQLVIDVAREDLLLALSVERRVNADLRVLYRNSEKLLEEVRMGGMGGPVADGSDFPAA